MVSDAMNRSRSWWSNYRQEAGLLQRSPFRVKANCLVFQIEGSPDENAKLYLAERSLAANPGQSRGFRLRTQQVFKRNVMLLFDFVADWRNLIQAKLLAAQSNVMVTDRNLLAFPNAITIFIQSGVHGRFFSTVAYRFDFTKFVRPGQQILTPLKWFASEIRSQSIAKNRRAKAIGD